MSEAMLQSLYPRSDRRIDVEMVPPRILVFDSGLGGLSVLREITQARPALDVIYVADDAGFPYGAWNEAALIDRVTELMGVLIARYRPDLVVIACNTASTLVLEPLRARYSVPFIGTVPAIKPAAAMTRSGLISILATPATVARDYTRQLIDTFARDTHVNLVGSAALAGLAEAWLRGEPVADGAIAQEIAPCFEERAGTRTDTVVLGCTHYPLLLEVFRRVAPWEVHWIDSAPAIARRVEALLAAWPRDGGAMALGSFVLTSGATPNPALRQRLALFHLEAATDVVGGDAASR